MRWARGLTSGVEGSMDRATLQKLAEELRSTDCVILRGGDDPRPIPIGERLARLLNDLDKLMFNAEDLGKANVILVQSIRGEAQSLLEQLRAIDQPKPNRWLGREAYRLYAEMNGRTPQEQDHHDRATLEGPEALFAAFIQRMLTWFAADGGEALLEKDQTATELEDHAEFLDFVRHRVAATRVPAVEPE